MSNPSHNIRDFPDYKVRNFRNANDRTGIPFSLDNTIDQTRCLFHNQQTDNELTNARKFIINQDSRSAIKLYKIAISKNQSNYQVWHDLGFCYCLFSMHEQLGKIINSFSTIGGNDVSYFQGLLLDLVSIGAYDLVIRVAERVGKDKLYFPVAVYYIGVSLLRNIDHDLAISLFDKFKALVGSCQNKDMYANDSNLNLIYR